MRSKGLLSLAPPSYGEGFKQFSHSNSSNAASSPTNHTSSKLEADDRRALTVRVVVPMSTQDAATLATANLGLEVASYTALVVVATASLATYLVVNKIFRFRSLYILLSNVE